MEIDIKGYEQKLNKKMTQLRRKSYISEELIDLLDAVTHRQLLARVEAQITLPPDQTMTPPETLLQGVSLLAREDFPYDVDQATDLVKTFLALLQEKTGPMQRAANCIQQAFDSKALSYTELFKHFLNDYTPFFREWAERTQDAPKIVSFLAFASLGPSLEAAASLLAEKLPTQKVSPVGTCPLCGSLPLISSLDTKEGIRHATCSFCRHEYRIKRIGCPICGEEKQDKLTFFVVDEEPGFRVDVCETCKTYIKTIDFRDLDRIAIPVLDDLDSLALDYVAAGQGYKRATLSAWGF